MELLDSFRNWLREIIESFVMWIVELFKSVFQWFQDTLLNVFESILAALRHVISLIPMPDILQYSLQDLISFVPPELMYFLNVSGISEAFMFISMGVAFRMVRKVATLFQW
ncbi:hypothetical protein ACJ7VZ_07000 [Aeromonas salmonicida]|uniref:hypothetical protein n=1 Tax=Aeromonas salmonicida TaxID=645 RepID=UPI0038B80B3D